MPMKKSNQRGRCGAPTKKKRRCGSSTPCTPGWRPCWKGTSKQRRFRHQVAPLPRCSCTPTSPEVFGVASHRCPSVKSRRQLSTVALVCKQWKEVARQDKFWQEMTEGLFPVEGEGDAGASEFAPLPRMAGAWWRRRWSHVNA